MNDEREPEGEDYLDYLNRVLAALDLDLNFESLELIGGLSPQERAVLMSQHGEHSELVLFLRSQVPIAEETRQYLASVFESGLPARKRGRKRRHQPQLKALASFDLYRLKVQFTAEGRTAPATDARAAVCDKYDLTEDQLEHLLRGR